MSTALDDINARIARANHHLDELLVNLQAWAQSSENLCTRLTEDEAEGKRVRLIANDPVPPSLNCRLIIGDVVHCLRTALDHTAYQLVLKSGCVFKEKDVQFPILDKSNLGVMSTSLPSVDMAARAIIEALQPYNRTHAAPTTDLLWILKSLNNIDKHRLVLVVAAQAAIGSIIISTPSQVTFRPVPSRTFQPLVDGKEFASFSLSASDSQGESNVNTRLMLTIKFDQTAVCDGEIVVALLERLRDDVAKIVGDLSKFL